MSRSVDVFLWSAVLVLFWMGTSCAALETTHTAVVTEAHVTVDGDTSYGYTKMPVPTVRQYEDESSSDNPSNDSSDDSVDDDWERSKETVTQLKNGYICEDRVNNCDSLARNGNWCVDNIEYMTNNCPVTCGICEEEKADPMQKEDDDNCEDLDSHCGWLASMGRCHTHTEATFMAKKCPLSCGLCVPRNEEEEEVGGEFRTSRDMYLAENSYVSCVDDDENCEYWAGLGECETNASFMLEGCRKSCNACDPEEEQEDSSDGDEETDDDNCEDLDIACGWLARVGQCDTEELTEATFMAENCHLSCGLCV
eukprot:scaffold43200_cov53-Attheya_sp.AAC.1